MNKRLNLKFLIFIFGIIFSFSSCIASEDSGYENYKGFGVVKEFSIDEGWITIEHGYIKGYSEAGKMVRRHVDDSKLLNSIKINDKVEFELAVRGDIVTLTGLKNIE